MEELRARIEAFRAKSPALARRSHASKSSDDGTNAFKSLDERDERAAPRVAVSPRSPAVYAFANDDDARASVDAALKHPEALSATAPGVAARWSSCEETKTGASRWRVSRASPSV